ncbi:DNA-binding transcriptional regulator, MarR family [Parafrankia irregularis]|uniref:DNA-binding transcriptional regulator, MarR family n=1 Tax=Parafrankia irregularis TaxID=795642 RepID=A0A0S4QYK9_9ACTN|nr:MULTISPECIES: MarR family transcriptional regulator [Parafrankia]MBE3204876.1 MarR family transcriptional regulator [Parafrankia sp. CH37]CUU60647.1 DNA-binding transcriptional regulator, MarR family [Parafrankia irregularis]
MGSDIPVDSVRTVTRLSRVLERSLDGLSLAQYRVLAQIAAGDERASRIAHRLALGKPAVSAAVESLRQRGLLSRGSVDEDRRAVALALTDEGRAVFDAAERAMATRLQEIIARTADPDGAVAVLRQLGAAVEELMSERAAGNRSERSGCSERAVRSERSGCSERAERPRRSE